MLAAEVNVLDVILLVEPDFLVELDEDDLLVELDVDVFLVELDVDVFLVELVVDVFLTGVGSLTAEDTVVVTFLVVGVFLVEVLATVFVLDAVVGESTQLHPKETALASMPAIGDIARGLAN